MALSHFWRLPWSEQRFYVCRFYKIGFWFTWEQNIGSTVQLEFLLPIWSCLRGKQCIMKCLASRIPHAIGPWYVYIQCYWGILRTHWWYRYYVTMKCHTAPSMWETWLYFVSVMCDSILEMIQYPVSLWGNLKDQNGKLVQNTARPMLSRFILPSHTNATAHS